MSLTFEQARQIIESQIRKLPFKREPEMLYDPIEYIISIGGKRLRPSLTLMSCSLYSSSIDHAIMPALGIEFFHNFTLLHDDIMDNSPLRRNKQTVHEKWNRNTAILSGDAMSILAYQFISASPSEFLPDVLSLFNTTALEVCEGQQYDMLFENMSNISVTGYFRMIELKTSVLIAASLKLGAILGGAAAKDSQQLYEFGKNLGMAFQIRDDLLDLYGDPEKFGKKTGNDIITNKKTFLLLKALELSSGEGKKQLLQLISGTEMEPLTKIAKAKEIFNRLNIKQITENQALSFFQQALVSLSEVSVEESEKKNLKDLAEMLIQREH